MYSLSKSFFKQLLILLVSFSLIASSFPQSADAVGFDNFQLTTNGASPVYAQGGKYLVWTPTSNTINYVDTLLAKYGAIPLQAGTITSISADPSGTIVFKGGSDIWAYDINNSWSYRLTTDGESQTYGNPRIAGSYITYSKTVSGTPHVIAHDLYNGQNAGVDMGAGTNPRVIKNPSGDHIIFFEDSTNIKYWNTANSTVVTGETPGALCSNNKLGEAAVGGTIVAFVKTCTLGDQTYYFDTGASASSTADDSKTKVSSDLLTSANTPVAATSGSNSLVAWVEGSLLTTSTIQVKGVLGSLLGLVGLGNSSLLNNNINAAADTVVWQQNNANGTVDVLGRDHSGSGTDFTVQTGATLSGISPISEVPGTGAVWGGFIKSNDLYVMVPKITTPTGTNVFVSAGNNTSVTFPTVSTAGETKFTAKSVYTTPTAPLTGFKLGTIPTYYDVHTTAVWSGTATVCFEYNPSNFNDNPGLLQLLHNESGSWVARTTSIDTSINKICAGVTSFSDIAFAVRDASVISSVDVSTISNVAPTNITITGTGILSGPKFMLGTTPLTNVQQVDENTFTATIPADIQPGAHDLILSNRYGSGATLASAITVTAQGLSFLKGQLADAGVTAQNAPKVYKLVDRADAEIKAGRNKQAANILREFQKELRKISGIRKQGFNFNLVPKAHAASERQVDPSTVKGSKRVEEKILNESLKLPKTTVTPKPAKAPRVITDAEKTQAILSYTDGLITKLETSNENPLVSALPLAAAAAALGSILIVHHHVRKRRKAKK